MNSTRDIAQSRQWGRGLLWLAIWFVWGSGVAVWAQETPRPPTEKLLPETTVAFVQLRDFQEFLADLQNTNFGRMMQDEKIAPLVDDLYGQAQDAFADFQDQIGLEWSDITDFPHGEMTFAMVAPRRSDPQFALFFDINPESPAAENLLNRGRELVEQDGKTVEEEESESGVTFRMYPGDGVTFVEFRKENTLVITTDKKLSEEILLRWNGQTIEKVRPLSENRKFVTVMNRCRGTKDLPPEMRLYVDPIEIFRATTRGDIAMQTAINFLPVLGLDGLLAIGAAGIFDEMEFESITHMHILMANPRAGLLEMLALKPGDYRPEKWVMADTGVYAGTSWDIPKFYSELEKIVDLIGGEDTFSGQIDNINNELELNLEDDVLPAFNGRVTLATWMESEVSINAQVTGFGIGLKDIEKAEALLAKIKERVERNNNSEEPRIFEEEYEGITLWRVNVGGQRERLRAAREEGRIQVSVRATEPTFSIIGETLVFSDSLEFVKRAIETFNGDNPSLVDQEDFVAVTKQMNRLLGTDMPCGVFFSQPGPTFQNWIKLAQSDDVSSMLDSGAEENQYLERLRDSLKRNPLPSYQDIEQYFKPSGGFMTNDDTGYHWLQFQMKGDK